jgi:hypothetical protein
MYFLRAKVISNKNVVNYKVPYLFEIYLYYYEEGKA